MEEEEQASETPDAEAKEQEAGIQTEPVEDVTALKARLAELESTADQYLNSWKRSQADFINYKRRVEQERAEVARLANAALIINVLPVLDDLERALYGLDVRLAGLTWVDGIRLIYRKLQLVLENSGVTEVKADGEPFDPTVHEAITEAEGEEGKVLATVQKGYKLGERVIRPALVVVGRGKEERAPEEPKGGQEPEAREEKGEGA